MNRNKYRRVMEAVFGSVWAIQLKKFREITTFIKFANDGGIYKEEEIPERIGITPKSASNLQQPGVAVIPIQGVIAQRVSLMSDVSGGVSTEQISADLRNALGDDTVKSIMFDLDSPGGTVYGVEEVADEIYRARGRKPMTAAVNSLAASAAYWIASAADQIVVTPGGEVGSVGVFMEHLDMSKALESEGMDMTLISAGPYKTEGNPYEPLTDEARIFLQGQVDRYYGKFVSALARNRGVSSKRVREEFGEGRVFGAEQALEAKMVDRVSTFDQTIASAVSVRRKTRLAERRILEIQSL